MQKPKVIALVGPTASGKTSLSIALAKKFSGEIISADSRQIYRGLDIGTGKVTKGEMNGIPHYLLDVVNPEENFTVTDFVSKAEVAISDIHSRNKLPIIVGGTFFYVDALLGRTTSPNVPPDPTLREQLEVRECEDLFKELQQKDTERANTIDPFNKRRLVRALEIVEHLGTVPRVKTEAKFNYLLIGIKVEKGQLQQNIHNRLEERLEAGMVDEVVNLLESGLNHERLEELGIEYKYISQFLRGAIDVDTMKKEIETKSWQYAKRQMTWLKRDDEVTWFEISEQQKIERCVEDFLNK